MSKRPNDYYALIYLGEAYENNNQMAAAAETYNQAIAAAGAKPEGFVGLGRVAINSNQYEASISF